MATATMNGIALIGIGIIAFGLIIWWIDRTLRPKRWVCAECGFETHSEEEALGHTEYHKTRHKMEVAE